MTPRAAERTGVLVVRAWFEPGSGGGLRARVTSTLDVAERDETVTAASSPEEIARALVDWLEEFLLAAEVTER